MGSRGGNLEFNQRICGDEFEAYSAGLEPGTLNPLVVEAMQEIGMDISQSKTKSVFDLEKCFPAS
jgi:arsenate reductase